MTEIWGEAALWIGLALVATLLSIWLRFATVLPEIFVGHRGKTLFERWLVGSVAKYVINHAPCAVLAAR
jgi:hypothetical protein